MQRMPIGTDMCAHNISVMPHGSVQWDLHCLLGPASSSNQGLLTITILAQTQWDMPHVILIVSSTRGITFKVVVCFNAYT